MHRRWIHITLLAIGVLCGSTAVIMIKASDENPYLLAAFRLLIATIFMLPLFLREKRYYLQPYGFKQVKLSLFPGLLLGLHFITWNMGVALTPVANASLIVNTTPAVMPFFLWIFFQEKVNRVEILGTFLALAGLVILGIDRLQLNSLDLRGHILCFISMLLLAAYMALGRKNNGKLPIWLYMWPLYLTAGIFCLLCALPFVNPIKNYTLQNTLLFLGLAIIPTFGGHTLLNYSMKNFRGQVVSVANLGQIIFSAFFGFLFFDEVPTKIFYLIAMLILTGVIIILNHGYRHR
ncbi:MAG: DMT family transporter [Anaerolineaceae bacterium]|nr:DMT family transporter [Anaerolineaceae bacterium]